MFHRYAPQKYVASKKMQFGQNGAIWAKLHHFARTASFCSPHIFGVQIGETLAILGGITIKEQLQTSLSTVLDMFDVVTKRSMYKISPVCVTGKIAQTVYFCPNCIFLPKLHLFAQTASFSMVHFFWAYIG